MAVRSGEGVEDGDWLDGWNFEDGRPFTGDSTNGVLEWNDKERFDSLKGRPIRLHFWLQDAELFSFWFE